MMRLITRGGVALAFTALSMSAQTPSLLSEPDQVVVIQGAMATGLYHRTTCPWVVRALDSDARKFPLADAKQRYFHPHCLCITGREGRSPCGNEAAASSPPVRPAAAASGAALSAAPATASNASEVVYFTRTGTKYHRATCRFAANASPTTLGEATARYGACAVCKPPTLAGPPSATAPSTGTATIAPRPSTPRTVAPAREVSGQCAATTKKGTRCSRRAQAGRAYCWQH